MRPTGEVEGARDPFAPGLLARLPKPPGKVVLVRASRIGDFLCATPAFRAFRAALPAAEITLIALPFVRELAERLPALDRFVPFPGFPGIAEQFFEPRSATAFFQEVQRQHVGLAVQLHGSGVYANPFTLLLGAAVTAGFVRPGDGAGRLDAATPLPDSGHEIERVLALPRFLGLPDQGLTVDLPLLPEDHAHAATLLEGADPPFFALHPAAREAAKRWPAERFVSLGQSLLSMWGGTVLVVGSSDERDQAEPIASRIGPDARSLAGRTSLPVLGAILARCNLLVSNDSGPAHIAYALDVPTVTLFGPTDPDRWGPLGGQTSRHRLLGGRDRIDSIFVAEVEAAVAHVLRSAYLSNVE